MIIFKSGRYGRDTIREVYNGDCDMRHVPAIRLVNHVPYKRVSIWREFTPPRTIVFYIREG